jgi:DnaK suppressor protein
MAQTGSPSPGATTAARETSPAATPPAAGIAVRPNESPWTDQELTEVRAELETELGRIQRDLDNLQASLNEVLRDSGDGAGDDTADTGSKAFEREQELTLLANTRETLFQTERALQRIADGTYGTCESCGEGIGKARLQAFPRATLCVSCKQRQERR